MVGFPFPFWYKTATSRTCSAAPESRCGLVWLRLWLRNGSPTWAVQVWRLSSPGAVVDKGPQSSMLGRWQERDAHSWPMSQSTGWRAPALAGSSGGPMGSTLSPVLRLVRPVYPLESGSWLFPISYWQSSSSLWPACHRMGPYWCSLWWTSSTPPSPQGWGQRSGIQHGSPPPHGHLPPSCRL